LRVQHRFAAVQRSGKNLAERKTTTLPPPINSACGSSPCTG
jgi:hypothetical protein